MQDLLQTHYQIFKLILQKEFIELNVNKDMIIKNAWRKELNTKISSVALNTQTLKII